MLDDLFGFPGRLLRTSLGCSYSSKICVVFRNEKTHKRVVVNATVADTKFTKLVEEYMEYVHQVFKLIDDAIVVNW